MLLKMGTITANFIKPCALINLLLQISSERGTCDYPRRGRQQAAACPCPCPYLPHANQQRPEACSHSLAAQQGKPQALAKRAH